jgi:hypothetical protein
MCRSTQDPIMSDDVSDESPPWDTPIAVTLTPETIMNTVFSSAGSVHTGWESCVDDALVVEETVVADEASADHCRLAQQEYADSDAADDTWHDWTIELQLGTVYIMAHWRARAPGSPADWDWCATEAEQAFTNACVLLGRRVRRGLLVDMPPHTDRPSRTRH